MPDKSGGRCSSAHNTCERSELHATRRFTGVIPVDSHYSVTGGKSRCNGFAATACCHRIFDHRVEIVMGNRPSRCLEKKFINTFPLAENGIKTFPFFDR